MAFRNIAVIRLSDLGTFLEHFSWRFHTSVEFF